LSEPFQMIEKAAVPERLTVINGLPDVGLVGVIATSHLISSLKMEEKVHVESTLLPPIMVFHKGLPSTPMRIYGTGDLATVISEIAIPTKAVYPLANAIVDCRDLRRDEASGKLQGAGARPAPRRVQKVLYVCESACSGGLQEDEVQPKEGRSRGYAAKKAWSQIRSLG